jgi:hypothetical protein
MRTSKERGIGPVSSLDPSQQVDNNSDSAVSPLKPEKQAKIRRDKLLESKKPNV